MATPLPPQTIVAVVGAGAMGAGIAQVAAVAGHRVKLLDNRPDVAARAVAGIQAQLAKMAEKGRLTAADAAAAGKRLTPVHAIADLAGAGLVVEAIVEDLAEKQALFADLEGIVGRDCILCIERAEAGARESTAGLRQAGGAAIADLRNAQLTLSARVKQVEDIAGASSTVDLSDVRQSQQDIAERLAALEAKTDGQPPHRRARGLRSPHRRR